MRGSFAWERGRSPEVVSIGEIAEREKGEGKIRAGSCRAFLWFGGQDREDSRVLLERGEKQRSFLGRGG